MIRKCIESHLWFKVQIKWGDLSRTSNCYQQKSMCMVYMTLSALETTFTVAYFLDLGWGVTCCYPSWSLWTAILRTHLILERPVCHTWMYALLVQSDPNNSTKTISNFWNKQWGDSGAQIMWVLVSAVLNVLKLV